MHAHKAASGFTCGSETRGTVKGHVTVPPGCFWRKEVEKVIVDLQSGLMVPLLPTWEPLGVNNNTQKPPSPSLFLQQQLQQLIKGENSARAPGTPSLLDCTLECLSERWREKDRERELGD